MTKKEKELEKLDQLVQDSEHFAKVEKMILIAPDGHKYLKALKDCVPNDKHMKRVKATVEIIQEAKEKLQELGNEQS